MNLEDRFSELASLNESEQPAVLLCDRGIFYFLNTRNHGWLGLYGRAYLAKFDG
jgi:hypothetical protein